MSCTNFKPTLQEKVKALQRGNSSAEWQFLLGGSCSRDGKRGSSQDQLGLGKLMSRFFVGLEKPERIFFEED